MKNLIIFLIITILYLFPVNSVGADSVAGNSAQLAILASTYEKDFAAQKEFKIKLAIKNVLQRYDSPLVDEVDSFYSVCQKYELDCYLLPSITGIESYFGQQIYPDSNNPFGWGRGLIMFESWSEGINTVASGLKNNYIDKGADTIEKIGKIYCEGDSWSSKVRFFRSMFEAEEEKILLYSDNFPVKL